MSTTAHRKSTMCYTKTKRAWAGRAVDLPLQTRTGHARLQRSTARPGLLPLRNVTLHHLCSNKPTRDMLFQKQRQLKGAGYTAPSASTTQGATGREARACTRPDEQPEDLGGGLLPPSLDILYITMLRALLASLLLTALYARALTGAERRAPLRAKRTKRPPSSSAGAKTRTRYVDDPGFVGDGYFEAVEVHRREPPRAARTPALDFGNSTRPVYVADPLWL